MKDVQTGDLVKLFRRKRPGMGLVMKHVPDIVKEMENQEALCGLYSTTKSAHTWKERNKACEDFLETSGLSTPMAEAFLRYNNFQSYTQSRGSRKVKTSFVYIQWFKQPSEYEQTTIRNKTGWYPADWLRKVE